MNVLRIPVADLRKGMFVVKLPRSADGSDRSVYRETGFVPSDESRFTIRARGYTCAYVDPDRSDPPLSLAARVVDADWLDPDAEIMPPSVNVLDELDNAVDAREQALEALHDVASRTLLKTDLSLADAALLTAPLRAGVERNANALLCLSALHGKDDDTFAHSVDVAVLALVLGRSLGVRAALLEPLTLAGFFHDVGKLFVPTSILKFPGRLNDRQFAAIRRHVELGHDYLESQGSMPPIVLDGVLDHQERWDGSGYPNGKTGNDISFTGRIMAVVDVYNALSGKRCYRQSLSPGTALARMYADRERDFAPGMVESLVAAIGVYPPGCLVLLSTGHIGVVVEANPVQRLRPKVVLLTDSRGCRVRPKLCDLSTLPAVNIKHALDRLPFELDIESAIRNAD